LRINPNRIEELYRKLARIAENGKPWNTLRFASID